MEFNIIIILLLISIIIILIYNIKKSNAEDSNIDKIYDILKKYNEEQTDKISKQISIAQTEQFQRFGFIQESVQNTLKSNREEIAKQLFEIQQLLDGKLSIVQQSSSQNLEKINSTLESKMNSIQENNEKRLEQIQNIVDEKLQKTIESRLSQSFEIVRKQLESVQVGLGEMKSIAEDAKSLKNALTNVKERGTYGEIRLEKLLSDTLAPSQYETNVEISSGKRVEFAIKLPGNNDLPLLLPIDSKFPIEDYNRLIDSKDRTEIDDARKSFAQKIRSFAKDIHDKYILPPKTTDFALMFLPTEGLYAEIIQNAVLFEDLRAKYKITVVGPSTLSAFLSSLQMGFKTLALEKRSQEVWDTLRSVKSEFIKFADALDKAHKKIQDADKNMDLLVGTRTRAINRALRGIDTLEDSEESKIAIE